jgi:hypothetical protein
MSILVKQKALQVAEGLVRSHGMDPSLTAIGDGTFLEWLEKMIDKLLPYFLKCFGLQRNARQIARALHNPNIWQRRRLRVEIRDALADRPTEDVLAGPLETEIWKMCDGITEADAKQILDEYSDK